MMWKEKMLDMIMKKFVISVDENGHWSGEWNNKNGCHKRWNVYEKNDKDNDVERKNVRCNNEEICY